MTDCLFCKMATAEISVEFIYEDDFLLAFKDINPQAPFHVLIIPRKHISTINDIAEEDSSLIGNMTLLAAKLAQQNGFANAGYRTVMNCNADGGQSVFHIHMHVLAGRAMSWPPG